MESNGMLTANYTIVVAIIGAVASVITLSISKAHEKKVELRKIKESQYIDFLSYLAKAKVVSGDGHLNILTELSVRIQTIFLVGNKDVQESLAKFLDRFTGKSTESQDKLYGELILAMKKDLYGRRFRTDKYISLNEISFVVFNDK